MRRGEESRGKERRSEVRWSETRRSEARRRDEADTRAPFRSGAAARTFLMTWISRLLNCSVPGVLNQDSRVISRHTRRRETHRERMHEIVIAIKKHKTVFPTRIVLDYLKFSAITICASSLLVSLTWCDVQFLQHFMHANSLFSLFSFFFLFSSFFSIWSIQIRLPSNSMYRDTG